MKGKMLLIIAALMTSWLSAAFPAVGKDSSEIKYSNIGLKLNLGLGSQDVAPSQDLEKGKMAALSLGYGVSQRVTLWLGMEISKHAHELNPTLESDLLGVELGLQYKLRPNEKFRPYGKIGLGTFVLGSEQTDTWLNGGGVTWALGAEYRLVRFLSIGAELFWKDFEYTRQRVGKEGDFTNMERTIRGDTNGFMLSLTLH